MELDTPACPYCGSDTRLLQQADGQYYFCCMWCGMESERFYSLFDEKFSGADRLDWSMYKKNDYGYYVE